MTDPTTALFPFHSEGGRKQSIGILSTYPPTPCGLATFSAALSHALTAAGVDVHVVRLEDGPPSPRSEVIFELAAGSPGSLVATAKCLNACDVAIVQHEYGLFGGTDGDDVLDIMAALDVPSIVIAHTVLREPTPNQRAVLESVATMADRLVVMTGAARARLLRGFDIDAAKVVTIPHGAAVPDARPRPVSSERPDLLTWGLIGPGKGIERVIDAMCSLCDLPGRPRYLVAGQTHPKVFAANGESYRNTCIRRAWHNGVAASIIFDSNYRDGPALASLIQSATAVVLPYDSTDQVTSGVLVDAIAAGRPVVATAFPHAVELLSGGAGIVVDHDDPVALELALHRVLTEPDLVASMAAEASRLAPNMSWAVIAARYRELASALVVERTALV